MNVTQLTKIKGAIAPLLPQLHRELRPSRLLPNITIGLTTGAVGVLFDLSFAALIFSGSLSQHLSVGIGLILFSAAATRVMTALMSSFPGMVTDLGTVPTAILAWSAGMIAKSLPASATPTEVLVTVLTAIALTSLLTGAFLLLLGLLRVGELVRTVPYPVVGGFVASTGWLLVKGAVKVMTEKPFDFAHLPALMQSDVFIQWLPGLLLALYLMTISQRRVHPFVMSASLFAAIALFYTLLPLTGTSIAQASTQGWMLNVSTTQASWHPLMSFSALAQVRWEAIAHQLTCMVTVIIVTAISLLLNITGMELIADREVDVNRELKVAGIANLIVGLGGGILSYHSLSKSVLEYKMGSKSRVSTLIGAGVFVAFPIFGSSVLSYFPKSILGGLLLFLGLTLLKEWVVDGWFKLSKGDFLIVQSILVVSGTVGFLQGLTVGWMLAMVLFVVHYSRIHAPQAGVSGAEYRSAVKRQSSKQGALAVSGSQEESFQERQVLCEKGDELYVLELQGFLFFGTTNSLIHCIRQRIGDAALPAVRFILLDFQQVSDVDSSAVQGLTHIKRLAHKHKLTLVLTSLQPAIQAKLQQGGYSDTHSAWSRIFSDLSQGVAWCEDQILQTAAKNHPASPQVPQFTALFLNENEFSAFMRYLELLQIPQGRTVFRQGDPTDKIYFVMSGQVSLMLQLPNGQTEQLQTFESTAVIGEGEFYWDVPRSASLIADQPTYLYSLSRDRLKQMEQEAPAIATNFHQFVTRLLSSQRVIR